MEKKIYYEAPEMESIILIKEAVMLNESQLGEEGQAGGPQSYNRYNDDF